MGAWAEVESAPSFEEGGSAEERAVSRWAVFLSALVLVS